MSTHRAGQRVRMEWPDGAAVEGFVAECPNLFTDGSRLHVNIPGLGRVPLTSADATITVLSDVPPVGLGAVVRAKIKGLEGLGRVRLVRVSESDFNKPWLYGTAYYSSGALSEVQVLSEGVA